MFLFLRKIQDKIDVIVTLSSVEEEERLRLNHYIWLCLIIVPMGIFPIIYNFYSGDYTMAAMVFLFSLLIIVFLSFIQKVENKEILYFITNVTYFSIVVYAIYHSEGDASKILWAYTYPLGIVFLFGNKVGGFWGSMMLASIFYMFLFEPKVSQAFTFAFQLKFLITYSVVLSITMWFENYRYCYFLEAKRKEEELINEHRMLKDEIKRRIAVEQKLEALCATDELTGVYNRRTFWELAEKEINRASRYENSLVLAILDVDNFKNINDSHGHPSGDEVLKILCLTCDNALRESDIFARIGGEEFAFLLLNVSLEDAYSKMDSLRKELEKTTVTYEKQTFSFTVSIGLAALSEENYSLELLYRHADEQMYEAKRLGRNRVQ